MKAVFFSLLFIFLSLSVLQLKGQANCGAATAIPIDVYGTCGDMAFTNVDFDGAVPSVNLPAPTCGSFNAATNDMWYSFVVPVGVTEMAFHAFDAPPASPAFPPLLPGAPACGPGMAVYRGNCGALTLLNCFSAPDALMQNAEIRWELIAGLIPGETIYVRLWEEDNDVTSMFFAASVLTSLPESDCSNPPTLSDAGCNILAPAGTVLAPEDCGWSSTDNVVFYSFEVLAGDPQPVTIDIEFGTCWANDVQGLVPSAPEIQFAVYSWNGVDCNGIGGSPLSTPANNTTYWNCRQGVGTVNYSENLAPGMYVLAMDGFSYEAGTSLCTFGIAASFLEPDPAELGVTLTTIDAGCGQQGSATVTINSSCGGTPTIAWSSSALTGLTASNLAAGNYTVTVTDNDAACGDTIINFTIGAAANFVVSVTTTGNPCAGPVTLTANVMGANPGSVSFSWNTSPVQNTQSIVASLPANYICTATYGTCIDTDNVVIVDADFDFSVNFTPTICAGSTGSAQFNAITGSGNYMFEWSTGAISPGIIILAPGNFCLTVTDLVSGCQDVRCFTVTQVPGVSVNIDSENISCHGLVDGTATAVASGGVLPYTYNWTTWINNQTIYDLGAGNYGVTVTDLNGCTGYSSVLISEPPQFFYAITPNQGICFGEQADIHVSVTGGVAPYLYSWSDVPTMNSADRTVSPPNTTQYTVTVWDDNLCTFTAQASTVIVSQPIIIDVIASNLLCHGVCNGKAVLDITGGIPPFIYTWSSTTDYLENLCAGNYAVTLTDLYGCTGSAAFEITEPDTVYLTLMSGPASCYGYHNGYGEVDVIGGVPFNTGSGDFYQYQWTDGQTLDSVALGFGFHNVTVTDANGCKHIGTAFVDQPEAVYVTNPWGGTICIGETFTTFAHATGGLGPYEFVWIGSDGSTNYGESLTVNPVTTTSYQLVVTDFKGCFGPVKNITVNVNPVIHILATTSSPQDICIGESIYIEMEVIGGNGGPYTIDMIDNGIVNMPKIFYPQQTGYYYFTVSDNCGSPEDYDSIYVNVHPQPTVAFFADHTAACPPSLFQFTETTPDVGQTYLWDFGDGGFSAQKNPQHTYTTSGTYNVSLSSWSEYGCERTRTYNNLIYLYPMPRAEFAATPELLSVLNALVEFNNYTDGGVEYFWDFGDGFTSMWSSALQMHTYKEVGEYDIMMVAKNQYECLDTAYKKVRVHDEFSFYAPDAFTPNGDGINDLFYVIGHGIDKSEFYLVIYDRFGSKVFETDVFDENNPYRMAWDGSHNGDVNKGDPVLTNGMYRWYCNFSDFIGKPHEESGTVTLIR